MPAAPKPATDGAIVEKEKRAEATAPQPQQAAPSANVAEADQLRPVITGQVVIPPPREVFYGRPAPLTGSRLSAPVQRKAAAPDLLPGMVALRISFRRPADSRELDFSQPLDAAAELSVTATTAGFINVFRQGPDGQWDTLLRNQAVNAREAEILAIKTLPGNQRWQVVLTAQALDANDKPGDLASVPTRIQAIHNGPEQAFYAAQPLSGAALSVPLVFTVK
jgi:hypothetical protein